MTKTKLVQESKPNPDQYAIIIIFNDGRAETYEVKTHKIANGALEFRTEEDTLVWAATASIKQLIFDQRFVKICEINAQKDKPK